jgi:hypothetical protein
MYEKVKKMISGLTVVVVISFFFTNVSQSQEIKSTTKEGGGMGYFMFGGSIIDIKALNSRLEDKGYSKISDNFISFGGGGHGVINRVIIGGEGHGLIGKEITSKSYKTSIDAGYGFFNLGYIVYSTEDLRVYSLLGLGGGGMSLNIVEKGILPSFDEVLDNPQRGVELSTGGFLLNLALGTDYLLKLGGDEKGKGGLILGLRVGYIFAPIKGDWEMDGVDISGAPDVSITGPYIRFMIGGGGFGKE